VLEVGQSVPHLAWLETYALQHGYLAARVDWRHVGARLVVEPEIVGGGPAIRLRLTPELSGLVDGQPMRTRFSRVSTEVTVNSGDSFRIGGLDQDAAFYERFLVGASRSGRQESLEVVLTPTIVDAGGVGAP
jgi:type II secretory pathway component GspD/PulD (secretin)